MFDFSKKKTIFSPCLYLLVLVALRSGACESGNIDVVRKDVEEAFSSKSFSSIAARYGESRDVQVTLENEYDEENPSLNLEFKNISALSTWFFEKHGHSENLIIPSPVVCRPAGCAYQLPELTLHHGVYLLGFEIRKAGECTLLTRLHIYWG